MRFVRPQVRAYRDSVKHWKVDFDEAQQCMDLEQAIKVGIGLYQILDNMDRRWRVKMAKGDLEYDVETEKALDEVFDWWFFPCPKIIRRIKEFEAKGYKVEQAREFIALCDRAERAKTDR